MGRTRSEREIQKAINDLNSRMKHQPARRGFLDRACVETCGCTDPRCTCSTRSKR